LEQTTKAWTATRNELEEREGRLSKIDREYRERSYLAKNAEGHLQSFRECLANLLGNPYTKVAPTEDAIKETVRELISAALERKSVSGKSLVSSSGMNCAFFKRVASTVLWKTKQKT
jgi:hypothetical protein